MQADLNLKMLIFTVQAPRYQRGLSQPCPVLDSSVFIYFSSLIASTLPERPVRVFSRSRTR